MYPKSKNLYDRFCRKGIQGKGRGIYVDSTLVVKELYSTNKYTGIETFTTRGTNLKGREYRWVFYRLVRNSEKS